MSIYAEFENDEQYQIASNRGWSQFGDWADTLDAREYSAVVSLWEHGLSEQLDALRSQLQAARDATAPEADVCTIIDELLEALNGDGEVLMITNGIS